MGSVKYSMGELAEHAGSAVILKECLARHCATEWKFKLLVAKALEVAKGASI